MITFYHDLENPPRRARIVLMEKILRRRPTKAVIAAAGFGTRFLPQTKAMPKEMLPLVDKPIIQYVVEELVAAGIRDIIIVGSQNKRAIEDHFDVANEDLLANLRAGGPKKAHFIAELDDLANMANFIYVRQKGPYGSATPVLSAARLLDADEPFIYTFADDFFRADKGKPTRFAQMIELYERTGSGILSCKKITNVAEYDRYGVVAGEKRADGAIDIAKIVEKPGVENAPSDLASVSSYLLTGDTLAYLERAGDEFSGEGEFMFQPVMQKMIDDGFHFFATEIADAKYYDTGNKLEYLKTVVDFGLVDEKLGAEFSRFLHEKFDARAK